MKAHILPVFERLGRFAMHTGGFKSRTIEAAGVRLHAYEAKGTGPLPTIVVAHGLGSAATAFGPLLLRFRKHARRVIAVDMPGHGFSDAPAGTLSPERLFEIMHAAFDALVEEPILLVGNSLGGAVALSYASERAKRVRALVLVSPAGARLDDSELVALKSRFDFQSNGDAREFLTRLYHRSPWFVPLVASDLRAMFARQVVRDLLDNASAEHAASKEDLARLTMPILFLWGKSERIMPASALTYFRASLPSHAIVEEPEGVGHCPHLDDPSWLAERIARFGEDTMRATREARAAG